MELFRTRLDEADEVELTTEEQDALASAGAAQPPADVPTDGIVTPVGHETVEVVTWFQGDDPDRPSARKAKPKRKAPAKKKTAAKKKTTAAKKKTTKTTAKTAKKTATKK